MEMRELRTTNGDSVRITNENGVFDKRTGRFYSEVVTTEKQAERYFSVDKLGFTAEKVGETEAGSEIFELKKDETVNTSGDYSNPILWHGQDVETGKWYYTEQVGKDLPREAVRSGNPITFDDKMYFDWV